MKSLLDSASQLSILFQDQPLLYKALSYVKPSSISIECYLSQRQSSSSALWSGAFSTNMETQFAGTGLQCNTERGSGGQWLRDGLRRPLCTSSLDPMFGTEECMRRFDEDGALFMNNPRKFKRDDLKDLFLQQPSRRKGARSF